ncbi:MAG: PAS domain-containing protein [Sphingobacteriales bacterium]|nr:MAG: PAS domain-containing protein [Sphingobacteriales bacterium]
MQIPQKPANEHERLAALNSYHILDTVPEEEYESITRLAAYICQTPVALISMVDEQRQWFKSIQGVNTRETPREIAFCAHNILDPTTALVVEDARLDKRFAQNPLVTGEPNIVFYAGVPIVDENGYALGSLCVIDAAVRQLSDAQMEALKALARQVMALIRARKTNWDLMQSEVRFRTLIEEAPLATCLFVGRELRVEVANKPMFDIWGKGTDVIGMPLAELLPEMEGQPFLQLLDDVFTSGGTYSGTDVPADVVRNGVLGTYYFDFTYKAMRDDSGTVYGIIQMAQDVTDRIHSRQQLRERNLFASTLINESSVAQAVYLGEEMIVDVMNQKMLELLGRDADIVGKPFMTAMPELKDTETRARLLHVYKTGEPFYQPEEEILFVRHGEPHVGYYQFDYRPLRNVAGEIYGVVNTATEITNAVVVRQVIEEKERALRNATDLAELANWRIDLQSETMIYSPRMADWLGADSYIGEIKDFENVIPEDQTRVAEAFRNALLPEQGVVNEIYTILNLKTTRRRIIHVLGTVRFDASGVPVAIEGTAQDVTLQKEVQQELETKVLQRTEELAATVEELSATNEELAQSNAQLQHSNDELAQYAYVASHDLQEPLRKIRIFSNMLSGFSELSDKTQGIVAKISSSAERMSLLIQDLLTFSRLLRTDALTVPVSIRETVQNIWTDFELIVTEKKATLQVDDLPEIEAVSLQMNQLFYNLIGNALKFTAPDRPPHIHITCQPADPALVTQIIEKPIPGVWYQHFTVADNGIGFDAQYTEQIFDVFKRLHGRENYPGSGIGLAVCKRVVTNHNGNLYATSSPGGGAAFHIVLPERQQV